MNEIIKYYVCETNSEITLIYAEDAQGERALLSSSDERSIAWALYKLRQGGLTIDQLTWLNGHFDTTDEDEIDECLAFLDTCESKNILADESGLYEASGYVGEETLLILELREKGPAALESLETPEAIGDVATKYEDILTEDARHTIAQMQVAAKVCAIMADKMPERPDHIDIADLVYDWERVCKYFFGAESLTISGFNRNEDSELEEIPSEADFLQADVIELAGYEMSESNARGSFSVLETLVLFIERFTGRSATNYDHPHRECEFVQFEK